MLQVILTTLVAQLPRQEEWLERGPVTALHPQQGVMEDKMERQDKMAHPRQEMEMEMEDKMVHPLQEMEIQDKMVHRMLVQKKIGVPESRKMRTK